RPAEADRPAYSKRCLPAKPCNCRFAALEQKRLIPLTYRLGMQFELSSSLLRYSIGTYSIMIGLVVTSSCAKRYPVRGMIVRTDPTTQTALISHRDIGKYMPAMTMP